MKFRLYIQCESDDIRNMYKPEEERRKEYEWQNNPHKDAGVDLYCPEDITIDPGKTYFIKFCIKCALYKKGGPPASDGSDLQWKPCGFYLMPRSSISKTPLRMSNSIGVIDSGYRGQIMGAVDNISREPYQIEKGRRLFQVCEPRLEPMEIILVNNLDTTLRGEGGFGSTGN